MTKSAITRSIPFVLSVLVLLALAACGGGDTPATSPPMEQPTRQPTATTGAQPAATTVPTETPAPTSTTAAEASPTAAPAATTAPPKAPEPTDTPVPTPKDTPVPAPTEAPTVEPTMEPTRLPTVAPTAAPTEVPTATPEPLPATPSEPTTYLLSVHQPGDQVYAGKTVTFMVGNLQAVETAVWRQGGLDSLDLSASGSARSDTPQPSTPATATRDRGFSTSGLLARPAFQPAPPHVFAGTVTINGQPAVPGTVVTALVDGIPVPNAEATAKAASESPDSSGSVAQSLDPLGDNLLMVWGFDRTIQDWSFYDPSSGFAKFNTIREMAPGGFYYLVVERNQTVTLNGRERTLFPGWNPERW